MLHAEVRDGSTCHPEGKCTRSRFRVWLGRASLILKELQLLFSLSKTKNKRNCKSANSYDKRKKVQTGKSVSLYRFDTHKKKDRKNETHGVT